MPSLRSIPLSALVSLTAFSWQAHAAYQAVETFNQLNSGSLAGQNGWGVSAGDTTTSTVVADPSDANNQVLSHVGINDAYKALPTPISDGSVGTLFYRLRVVGTSNNISFGLSDVAAPNLLNFPDFEIQHALPSGTSFQSRDGGGLRSLFTMTTGVWYNIWCVVDTTTDTYRIYIQRDGDAAYANQTELPSSDGVWNFRNGVAGNPLNTFLLMSNAGSSSVMIDDIYVDPAPVPNLTNPALVTNPDADGDGLLDAWEIFYFANTTSQNGTGDPDNDGASNEAEETAGSNPLVAASIPTDTDGDGLLDSWETTYFPAKGTYGASSDPDGDGATNLQEQSAGTHPANAASWPDSDGDALNDAWEIANFGSLAQSGTADPDGDGAQNTAEMAAGSSPNNANWTPGKSLLVHRWSFNGDLNNSVGTAHATIVDTDNNAATGGAVTQNAGSVTLAGGANATSAAVSLGANLVGGAIKPITIELWATQNAARVWSRIFDFGTSTSENLFMAWTRGTVLTQDRVEWRDVEGVNTRDDSTGGYAPGTQYHIVMTLTPAPYSGGAVASGTRVTWYVANSISAAGLVAKGSFDSPLSLASFNASAGWLGRSLYSDEVASATYDEVRIWDGALTLDEINTHQLAGPNSFSFVDSDADNLSDPWEQAYFGGLSENADSDSDGDGFTNAEEYAGGSDPASKLSVPGDIDGDGLSDNWEVSVFGNLAQTGSADPDGDLATNLQEFQAGTNPNSRSEYPDSDFDLLNDAWELIHFGNLAATRTGDADDDGSTNGEEYDLNLNPNDYRSSLDSDADGLPDGWEIFHFKLAGETGVANGFSIITRQSAADDPDADGFLNSLEYLYFTNPASAGSLPGDLNGDGIADGPVLKAGGDAGGTASFDSGLNWTDGMAPSPGKSYLVGVNGLRTPVSGSPTFAGDRLVLAAYGSNVGTLIWKTNSEVTIPVLQFDGGMINQAAGSGTNVTLNGTVEVTRNSTLWANNGSMLINSVISGGANLALTGGATVTFAGANTWHGSLDIAGTANRFTLASTGVLRFTPGAAGVTNAITGTGGFTLNGAFVIDSSGASTTLGDSWQLVANTGPKVYAPAFRVNGYIGSGGSAGSRKWSSTAGPAYYQFDETSGRLTVIPNPDVDADGLLDAWETATFGDLSRNGTLDYDLDGATDAQEFAAGSDPKSNSSWPDSDADGVNDAWEMATFGNLDTATAADRDADGLLDVWETTYFANIAAQDGSGDPDGDSYTNAQEHAVGSNPNLAASNPTDINGDGLADGWRLQSPDVAGTSSFNSGLNWQGAVTPAPGESFLVNIVSLRTPTGSTPYTFAGDRLVIYTGGNLLVKGSGLLTFPGNLILDGGRIHNGTDANALVTFEGAITVRSASEILAQNNGFVFNAAFSGSGTLNLTGGATVTLAGANTHRGNIHVGNTNGMTLSATGILTFAPGAIATSNAITGTGPVVLNGAFAIDTSSASTATGASWTLVATTGAKTYGAGFTVTGFTSDGAAAGARKWTKGNYQYDEATHTLSVVAGGLSSLQSWRITHFGDSTNSGDGADGADPDNDGRPNLLEYATGTLPNSANSGSVATVATSAGKLTLGFAYIADSTLTYSIEASNDLATWSTVHTYPAFTSAGTATYTDTVVLSSGSRRFLRLKVTAP